MHVALPADCGNAPRIAIVSEVIASWAAGDTDDLARWFTDDVTWTLAGTQTLAGPSAVRAMTPGFTPERADVDSIITHGRLASCDGALSSGPLRTYFSHVFRFASTAKTARIKDIRSYLINERTP